MSEDVCEVVSTAPDGEWLAGFERTRAEHPFEVAGVVSLPILDGGPDYVAWIVAETRAP